MEQNITCPKCGFEQQNVTECRRCGIVFEKYDPHRHAPLPPGSSTEELSDSSELIETTDRWIYPVRKKTFLFKRGKKIYSENEVENPSGLSNGVYRSGKYFIVGLMAFFFFYMVIKRSSWCFLDYINLPFHESGHIIFGFFGETIAFLGGTFGQLMWPAILTVYFIKSREPLSASFCLFWFGENFLNISKYVADARSMVLPLVGGGIHDWNFLLGKWHMLRYDHTIADFTFVLGVIIMAGSMVWAFFAKSPESSRQTSK